MDYDPTGTLVAFGQGDHTVKIFDVENNYVTHHFKGHESSVNLVKFHPRKLILVTVSGEVVKVWDLMTRVCIGTFSDHTSSISSIGISSDGKYLISAGRDSVINVYDLEKLSLSKTIPVFESIEASCFLTGELGYVIATSGENGVLKKLNIITKDVSLETPLKEKHKEIQFLKKSGTLFAITEENNFEVYDSDFKRSKTILGFNDEVLDIAYVGKHGTHALVVTNNEAISLYDLESKNAKLLHGHKDIALTVSAASDHSLFVSGAKDGTVFVWEYAKLRRVALGDSHSGAVTSVCFAQNSKFFCSVGDDKTLKLWDIEAAQKNIKKHKSSSDELDDKDITPLTCKTTIAHAKDIGQVCVSVDSKLIATASGDRTAKIWDTDLKMIHELKHRSGVWTVAFSNVEKCVATGSSDKLIRIWSLTTGVCLKVFEGHTKAILQVAFMNVGQQLLTTSADGIVKLWTIKTNECVNTYDVHQDRVWAIDVKNDGREFITGGEDSIINIWKDNTEVVVEEETKESDETKLQDQEIANLIRGKKTIEAIKVAIKRNRPKIIYELISTVDDIDDIIATLEPEQITQLLQYAIDWNTNTKFSIVAQKILNSLFKCLDPSFISFSYEKSVESLLAYSNRHMKRVESLLEKSYFLDYLIANMNMGIETKVDQIEEDETKYVQKTKFIPGESAEQVLVHDQMIQSLEQPKKKKKKD